MSTKAELEEKAEGCQTSEDYVGVAREIVQDLSDKSWAGELLDEGAEWAQTVDELVMFAKCATEEEKEALLKKQPPPDEPSLQIALFQGYGWCKLGSAILVYLLSSLLTFVPVLILEDIVRYFETDGTHDTYVHPWLEVAGLALVPFLVSVLQTRYQCTVAHAGVFVRAAVSLMLYHKSLKVSAAGRAKTSTGQVVNIMSNDSQQLQRLLLFAGMGAVAPVQIVLALALIYRQVSTRRKNCIA